MFQILTSLDFERRVDRSRYCAVMFFANHCGPSRSFYTIFKQTSDDFPDIDFYAVNVDNEEELAERYNIELMPTVMFLKRGRICALIRGLAGRKTLTDKLYDMYD